MKTTIRELIKKHLIQVCKHRTAIMRERVETKPKKQFTKKKIEEACAHIRSSLDQKHCDSIMNALAVLLDAPELSTKMFDIELFGALVLDKSASGHPHATGVPHFITKNPGGIGNRLFYSDGQIDTGYQFTVGDNPRPATDSEIESYVNNLNEKQWQIINHSTSIFAPIITEAMTTEIELLEIGDDTVKEAGDEIETNGRRITIGQAKE